MTEVVISTLAHTWLIDVDGTILKHNGHKGSGDELLPGVREFWDQIPSQDMIVLLSARTIDEMTLTLEFLDRHDLRYDRVLADMPKGERVLVNDDKPGGLKTAIAVSVPRDQGLGSLKVRINPEL